MNTTETIERQDKPESRTETMLDGTVINYVLVGPTGVRIYRKGGGSIDITNSDPRRGLSIAFNHTEKA